MALIFRNVKGSSLTYTEMDENLRLLYSASVYNATGSGVPVSSSYSSTASYYGGSVASSSYASTASYVLNSISSSYVQVAQTASYVNTAQTASYVLTSSYSRTASYVQNAITASYIQTAQTASYYGGSVQSASYSITASSFLGEPTAQIDLTNLGTSKGVGFVFPNSAPANPKRGSAYFDIGPPTKLWVYDGSAWQSTLFNP